MRVRTHANPLNHRHRLTGLNLKDLFTITDRPLDLEIGFGRGLFLREYASRHPERNILGVEVRKAIVDILRSRLESTSLSNVRLLHSTGQICLEDLIPNSAVERIFIFHPDPWFKKKHHKRRVLTPEFLNLAGQKLKPEGRLYVSTDVEPLWDDMIETIRTHSRFEQYDPDPFWEIEYITHWQQFSVKDQRKTRMATFVKSS